MWGTTVVGRDSAVADRSFASCGSCLARLQATYPVCASLVERDESCTQQNCCVCIEYDAVDAVDIRYVLLYVQIFSLCTQTYDVPGIVILQGLLLHLVKYCNGIEQQRDKSK